MTVMSLPRKFLAVHSSGLQRCYAVYGPMFSIIPREPIGPVLTELLTGDAIMTEGATVTIVRIRVVPHRDRDGHLVFEAADPESARVISEWDTRHRLTPREEFDYSPFTSGTG